jgi:hypothetical protein
MLEIVKKLQRGNGTIKNPTLHWSHETYQTKERGGGKLDKNSKLPKKKSSLAITRH